MKTLGIIGLILFGIFCAATIAVNLDKQYTENIKRWEVTHYDKGKVTATGDDFHPEGFTVAVKDRDDLHCWYRFAYRGREVYVYANDLMPSSAKADYDLSKGAFKMLANPREGRIRALVRKVSCP